MKKYILVGFAVFMLLGCRETLKSSAVSPFSIFTEADLQSNTWQALADDVTEQIKVQLDLAYSQTRMSPQVFIQPKGSSSKLNQQFQVLLTEQLTQEGINITAQKSRNTLVLDFDVQMAYCKTRQLSLPIKGEFVELEKDIWVVEQGMDNWDPSGLVSFPITMDIDPTQKISLPRHTNTEIIITTSLTQAHNYLLGDTNLYYANTQLPTFASAEDTTIVAFMGEILW